MTLTDQDTQYRVVKQSSLPDGQQEIITMFSTVDAIGKTTIALNLAINLAHISGEKVCIVDADLHFGDVCRALGIVPTRTIADFVAKGLPSGETIKNYLLEWENIVILAPPQDFDGTQLVSPEAFTAVIKELACHFRYIIIDTALGFSEIGLSAIDMSEMILFACTLDSMSCVKNLQRGLETLNGLGYSQDKVKLILNRYKAKTAISPGDVESGLKLKFAAKVTNNYSVANESFRAQIPFVVSQPDKEISQDILALAQSIHSNSLGFENNRLSLSDRLTRWLKG